MKHWTQDHIVLADAAVRVRARLRELGETWPFLRHEFGWLAAELSRGLKARRVRRQAECEAADPVMR
jgi:hypothetical protein